MACTDAGHRREAPSGGLNRIRFEGSVSTGMPVPPLQPALEHATRAPASATALTGLAVAWSSRPMVPFNTGMHTVPLNAARGACPTLMATTTTTTTARTTRRRMRSDVSI